MRSQEAAVIHAFQTAGQLMLALRMMRRIDSFLFSLTTARVAILALLGALIGIALTPFMAAVWLYEPGVVWSDANLVERTFGPWLESSGFLSFGPAPEADEDGLPYEVYGKGFFLVYLLMLPAARSIRPSNTGSDLFGRIASCSWVAVYVAIWVAMVCDFVSYWGKSAPGVVGDALWHAGGSFEILTVMLLMVLTLVFAVSSLISNATPRWISAVLALAIVAIVPVNIFITDYWPNSFIVPVSLGCAVIAIGRLATRTRTPVAPGAAPHRVTAST